MIHTLMKKFTTWLEKDQLTDAKYADSVLKLSDLRTNFQSNKITTL